MNECKCRRTLAVIAFVTGLSVNVLPCSALVFFSELDGAQQIWVTVDDFIARSMTGGGFTVYLQSGHVVLSRPMQCPQESCLL